MLATNTKRHLALSYAREGFPVLPLHTIEDGACTCGKGNECDRPGKHPLTSHGVKDATTKSNVIKRWWDEYPEANIGIATGTVSGLLVLDLDPRNGGEDSLSAIQATLGKLPTTPKAFTGGDGRHFYLKHPVDKIRSNTTGKVYGAGIDVLSNGSYVVAPGSTGSRRKYAWVKGKNLSNVELASLPKPWLKKLVSEPAKAKPVINSATVIVDGSRNVALASMAGGLHRTGVSKEAVLAALKVHNANCQPPLSDDEVFRIVKSITSYPANTSMVGEAVDAAQQLSQIVLNRFFEGGKHLLLDQGRFWHFTGTHWLRIEDDWLKSKVFTVIEEGNIKANHTTSSLLSQTFQILQARMAVNGDPLKIISDPPPVINTRTGELWISDDGTVQLCPHDPKSGLRSCLNIDYDPKASCPEYDRALQGIFGNAEEPKAMIRHWNELLGYIVQPRRDIPSIVMAMGRGANGKTALFGTAAKLLGEQHVAAQQIGKIEQNRFVMASLLGKLMLLDDDVAAGVRLPDGFLKTISEAKVVSGEEKFKAPFNFKVLTVPVLLCNNVPSLADMTYGMLRRLMVIPFSKTFAGKERDANLFKRIWANEMPGVLNRALEGIYRVRQRGSRFNLPKDVVLANEKFTRDANPFAAFMAECVSTKGAPHIYLPDLYKAFVQFCDDNGNTLKMQQSKVKQLLENQGYVFKRGSRGLKVIGLNLK